MVYRKHKLKVLLGPEKLALNKDDEDLIPDDILFSVTRERSRYFDQSSFGKIGETNVYKRTRPSQALQPRPRLERYPSGLQLSGQKVDSNDTSAKSARSTLSGRRPHTHSQDSDKLEDPSERISPVSKDTNMPSDSSAATYSPSLTRVRQGRGQFSANNTVSRNFLTDFGLRTERTDTFSGHHRHRSVASVDMERQMEEKAKLHIRTCQTFGNMKRSSKVQLGYQGLRAAVSPSHGPTPIGSREGSSRINKDKVFYKSDLSLDKPDVGPYMIQIRKNIGSISKTKTIAQGYQRPKHRPEINGRTIIVGTGYT